jgi:hypothetical protein
VAFSLVAGAVVGYALRALVGRVDRTRIRHFLGARGDSRTGAGSARQAGQRIGQALREDVVLASLAFDIVPVRTGHVELHGWVPSRAAGARAMRLAIAAAPDVEVTNRLLVEGEDDFRPDAPGAARPA